MKFNRDDIIVAKGRRGRVLGAHANLEGYVNVAFDDGKPYRTYAEDELELAPVTRVGDERFTVGPDESDTYWLNGDEGTNLRVDWFDTDRYGYIIDARSDGRTFIRDEDDVAERTFIEVA